MHAYTLIANTESEQTNLHTYMYSLADTTAIETHSNAYICCATHTDTQMLAFKYHDCTLFLNKTKKKKSGMQTIAREENVKKE